VAFIPVLLARILRAGAPGILACGVLLLSAPASAQLTLVHATSCGSQSFPTLACTIPATGNGNLIVVGWASAWGTIPIVTGVTDNVGNTYAEAGSARSVDSANDMVDIWYAKNSKAGATSLTITPSTSGTGAAMIWEFSGADTVSPLDQTSVLNSQPASTTPSGASITTGSANEVIISLLVPAGSPSGIVSGNPFTNDSLNFGVGWAHLFTTSVGTYRAQWAAASGTYASSSVSFKAAASGGALNPCDLNSDGVVTVLDVNLIVNMVLGQAACSANITGAGVCTIVTVQRVVNASLAGGTCTVDGAPPPPPPSHSVTLSWVASTTPSVSYNVYRSTTSGGPYSLKVNASPIAGLSYVNTAVVAGQTYYYVVTAVDGGGTESVPSNQAAAVIPTP